MALLLAVEELQSRKFALRAKIHAKEKPIHMHAQREREREREDDVRTVRYRLFVIFLQFV